MGFILYELAPSVATIHRYELLKDYSLSLRPAKLYIT